MAGPPPQYPYPYPYPQQSYGHPQYYQAQYGHGAQPSAAYDPSAYFNYNYQQYNQNAFASAAHNTTAHPQGASPLNHDHYGSGYPQAKRQRGNYRGGSGRGGHQAVAPSYADYYNNQAYQAWSGYTPAAASPTSQQPHPAPPPPPPPQVWNPARSAWQAQPPYSYPTPPYPTHQQYGPQHAYAYTPPAPPPQTYQHQFWHSGQAAASQGNPSRPVPVAPSSRQWRRPKTPPEQKEATQVKVEPAVPKDNPKEAKEPTGGVFVPVVTKPSIPARTSVNNATPTSSISGRVDSQEQAESSSGLDYLGEDVEGWYLDPHNVNSDLSTGTIIWRPPQPISSALPSDWFEATEQLKKAPPGKTASGDVSRYAEAEHTKPIQDTELWQVVKNDPIFRDLSQIGTLVSVGQARARRLRASLPHQAHQLIQGRDPGADAEMHDLEARAELSIAQGDDEFDPEPATALTQTAAGEDEEPYSPPPVSEDSQQPPPCSKAASHKRKYSALDTIAEEDESPNRHVSMSGGPPNNIITKSDKVQTVISHLEQREDAIQAKIEAITNAKQVEAENQQAKDAEVQARIEAITGARAPPPSSELSVETIARFTVHERRTSSTSNHQSSGQRRNSLPPKEFPKDESQEDVLAKLGVTGDAKPVFNMPAPARTEPPPGYEQRSRSRSRSHSPVKQMPSLLSNPMTGFPKLLNNPMNGLPPRPPPPPPPPPETVEADGRPFERPNSALSQRTAAASDFADDTAMETVETSTSLETISEETTPGKTRKRQRSESQDIDAATAQRLLKRPPKIDPVYKRRW